MKYLKLFTSHSDYDTAKSSLDRPNVSLCATENEVHYNPYVPPVILVTKYNITNTSAQTQIVGGTSGVYYTSGFTAIEIDGIVQPSVVSKYTFDTLGEHTIKYTLANPISIGDYAFYGCTSLTSVTIPNGVTSIGEFAFYNCYNLASVTIPNTITSIGKQAFRWCSSLTEMTIPSGVTNISDLVFGNCSGLTSVTIPSGVTSIGNSTFLNCSGLTNVIVEAITAPSIQSSTFQNIKTNGTLTVPVGSTGYNDWMDTGDYYLGKYSWTKVEQ